MIGRCGRRQRIGKTSAWYASRHMEAERGARDVGFEREGSAYLGRVMLSSRMEVMSAMKMVPVQQCARAIRLQYVESGATAP